MSGVAVRSGSRSRQTLTLTYRADGLAEVLEAFRDLPADASRELRDKARPIAEKLAQDIRAAGRGEGSQAAIVADTVTTKRDRLPVIEVGGTRAIGRYKKPAYKLLFASEFGMNRRSGWYARPRYARSTGMQYNPHIGRGSYWIFTTVDDTADRRLGEWAEAADDIIRDFVEAG